MGHQAGRLFLRQVASVRHDHDRQATKRAVEIEDLTIGHASKGEAGGEDEGGKIRVTGGWQTHCRAKATLSLHLRCFNVDCQRAFVA